MASETATAVDTPTEQFAWKGGALAGLIGGAVMGAMLTMQMPPVIEVAIPSMYGLSGLAAGWVAHLFHSVVFGLVFAAAATRTRYRDADTGTFAVLGAAYGVVLWLVAAAVVMPLWLGALGLDAPSVPNLDAASLAGHLVYGVVLGAALAATRTRL